MFNFGFSTGNGGMNDGGDKKHYDSLGVDTNASANDIKQAFRKLAMTHHPDKGGDAEKFKEISHAYEVLSDPKKRQAYDECGTDTGDNMNDAGDQGMHDIFADMFGFGMHGQRSANNNNVKSRGDDCEFPIDITLDELYNGTTKKLKLTRNVICKTCLGKGGRPEDIVVCSYCRGQGHVIQVTQLGPGMVSQTHSTCPQCHGQGNCIPDKPDTVTGDVVVIIREIKHNIFQRKLSHLIIQRSITLSEGLTSFQFIIPHLDGRTIVVQSQPNTVTKPGI